MSGPTYDTTKSCPTCDGNCVLTDGVYKTTAPAMFTDNAKAMGLLCKQIRQLKDEVQQLRPETETPRDDDGSEPLHPQGRAELRAKVNELEDRLAEVQDCSTCDRRRGEGLKEAAKIVRELAAEVRAQAAADATIAPVLEAQAKSLDAAANLIEAEEVRGE